MCLWLCFQINKADYPHFYLTKDGRLCSMGQQWPGFLRVLYNTLLHLGYKADAPIYCCRLSMAHGMKVCEASVMIPIDPSEPWMGSITGSEPDTTVEMMEHTTLTYLSESRLTATAALPTTLLPIWNQENPVWQQCLEAVSVHEDLEFSAKITSLAKYSQYLFNLQQNTTRISVQQRMLLTAYEESATAILSELERLRH
jgi:hypothetical protein